MTKEITLEVRESDYGFVMLTVKEAKNTYFVSVKEEGKIYTVVYYNKHLKEGMTEMFHNEDIAYRTYHSTVKYI